MNEVPHRFSDTLAKMQFTPEEMVEMRAALTGDLDEEEVTKRSGDFLKELTIETVDFMTLLVDQKMRCEVGDSDGVERMTVSTQQS